MGVVYVAVLIPPYLYIADDLDAFILENPYSPFVSVSLGILLCVIYPAEKTWSPARMDTYIIVAAGTGCAVGFWLNFEMGWIYRAPGFPPYHIIYPDGSILMLMLLRTLVGVVVLVAVRAVCKKIGDVEVSRSDR